MEVDFIFFSFYATAQENRPVSLTWGEVCLELQRAVDDDEHHIVDQAVVEVEEPHHQHHASPVPSPELHWEVVAVRHESGVQDQSGIAGIAIVGRGSSWNWKHKMKKNQF